MYFLTTSNHPE